MKRMSSLPVLQFCGGSATLPNAAGRPAAMSSAFHAQCAGSPGATELLARLTDEERATVATWKAPVDLVYEGHSLDYASAEKELEVGLDEYGFACGAGPDCMVLGHLDFAWVRAGIAFVADIKKTAFTVAEGPDSLQLHAYGWAYAQRTNCRYYVTGLWLATEGEWRWLDTVVDTTSETGRQIWERIRASALSRDTEFNTGEHCRRCYSRFSCPAHSLSATLAPTWLGPVAGGRLPSSPEEAGKLLLQLQAAEDILGRAKTTLQDAVRQGKLQVIDPESGKVWRPVSVKGRESVSVASLREQMGAAADQYISRGASFDQFRWGTP